MVDSTAFYVRVTHTGVDASGRESRASVSLYDLDDQSLANTSNFVPVPYLQTVNIPMTSRVLVSYTEGAISKLAAAGFIQAQVAIELRDSQNQGGVAGAGVTLRAGVPNIERAGNVLRIVIDDNSVGSPNAVGFYVDEQVLVSNLTGVYADLNGTYTITTVTSETGLSGAEIGSYLLEAASVGADIASSSEVGNLALVNGRQSVFLTSELTNGAFGHVGGIPVDGVSNGSGSSGGGSPTNPSAQEVTQAGHGFTVGQPIYFDGTNWQLGLANSNTSLATHIVFSVTSANQFAAIQSGYVEGLSGLTAGTFYFVSATSPGALETADPSSTNSLFYSNPIFLAVSATAGWALPWRAAGPNTTGSSIFSQFATTSSVAQNVQTLTLQDDTVAYLRSTLIGREVAPNTDSGAFVLQAKVTTTGSVPTISGVTLDFSDGDASASWSASYAVLGTSVVVQVTGDAANTVNWKLNTQVFTL